MRRRKAALWVAAAALVLVGATILVLSIRHLRARWSDIQGAVVRYDTDPRKQSPIAGAQITASYGDTIESTHSDASGYFHIEFPKPVLPGQVVKLSFVDPPGYEPLDLEDTIRFRSSLRELVIAAMSPVAAPAGPAEPRTPTVVANMRVRYTVNSENEVNIGSDVRTFVVVNRGDVPCHRQQPCSPDGYWKASSGFIEMDAGSGNEFRDARASCIAGPCPFTKIDTRGFVNGGRTISASAIDWSDTATFVLQAEVFRTGIVSSVRESYPVIIGSGFNFTVPPAAEGVSLVSELNGTEIVFPLDPDLYLSWATCAARQDASTKKSAIYQCELKPGYHF
jgi:hypothetical protein